MQNYNLFVMNVLTLQEDLKQRETQYENAEIQQEKEIIERKQLDLIHQFQTVSKQQQQLEEDTSSLSTTRKSLVEIQQTKPRPKSIGPITSKTQSLPKTMIIRNCEPSILRINQKFVERCLNFYKILNIERFIA
ncbi:unnamed protein product [Rotaria sp. Silwood2]|nr:unnamed protein product [Rotaria sp. Silwood2]CAF3165870.1 unnamed protein product [Rotaria sp. Silwood2]CAF3363116.1 unnamed protein product [Rotaria sp. Silwood2]CAF3366001.1 unnamed protein product [Rotaria sp. Silwood2]CAF4160205.1 unnamed protein product [Rotaria sp. Silwood2]